MANKNIRLSIIIPAYNEALHITDTLEKFSTYLSNFYPDSEIIIVDDGSTDNTSDKALSFKTGHTPIKLIRNEVNKGKGYSVRTGILAAHGDVILFSDADGSVPIDELPRFLTELESGAQVVIASRAVRDSNIIKKQVFWRQAMGKAFNVLVRLLAIGGISDTQCGFKCFVREAAIYLFSQSKIKHFAFDVEILYLARQKGYAVKQLGVKWIDSTKSTVNPFTDSARMFFDLLLIRIINARHIGK